MRWEFKGATLAIVAVVVEILTSSLTAASPTMGATSATRRRHADQQQQKIILRQQRQIEEYQRQLAARPQPAQDGGGDFLSSLFCPRGYTTTLFTKECYPILPAPVVIVPSR